MKSPDEHSGVTDALDDLIAAAGATRNTDGSTRRNRLRRWERAVGWTLLCVTMSGFLLEVVAASTLVANSGPKALAVVWPLGGAMTLALAVLQARYVDRLARVPVIIAIVTGIGATLLVSLTIWAATDSLVLPAALASIAADQLNFLLPIIVWSLAGDIFTAGQAADVYPRLTRWVLTGQILGLAVATVNPLLADWSSLPTHWVLLIPLLALASATLSLRRHLDDASASAGHRRSESVRQTIMNSYEFVRSLPAFRWIFWTSLFAVSTGTMLELNLLDALDRRFEDAHDLQVAFASIALAGFLVRWIVDGRIVERVVHTEGVAGALMWLPASTVIGALLAVFGGLASSWLIVAFGVLLWRHTRWGVDLAARHAAMASLPDTRRAGVTLLTELVPQAVGLILTPVALILILAVDGGWLLGVAATLVALTAVLSARQIMSSWADTQLSYRLKRRKRIT